MDEASLCERIAMMQNGKVMQIDSPGGITNAFKKPLSTVMFKLRNDLLSREDVESCYPFGEYHHLIRKDPSNQKQILNLYRSMATKTWN